MITMEVCANSVASAMEAHKGGAKRVELCASLTEGGTTPPYSQIKLATQIPDLEVFPIIRPRGGDFLYTALEFEEMKEDVLLCKSLGCEGVVLGILTADGRVDKLRCAELIELAKPMQVSFHRAFDMAADLYEALEDLIALGFIRVLTSGGRASAIAGADVLAKLILQAGDRISVMPGAGVNTANIAALISSTGAKVFHASARQPVSSEMTFRNENLNMGAAADEYSYSLTESVMVKNLLELANLAE